tara:strand:- start:1937 stop:2773 length:837 start_codon:yes stop_codon:yes gene_type:complete
MMAEKIKNNLKEIHAILYKYFLKVILKIFRVFFLDKSLDYKLYGTNYGGMIIADHISLENSIILSAGSGEDLTFDIELINKYQCQIILIDPTPRAIDYYELITNNFGSNSTKTYSDKGYELPEVYDLRKVNLNNLKLIKYALHHEDNLDIKFFAPPIEEHVSYSITNFRSDYSENSPHIIVKTKTINSIIGEEDINEISLIKLDIEGAEIPVIYKMLKDKIYPYQIAVEFGDLMNKKFTKTLKFLKLFLFIIFSGYKLANFDRYPNFLFIKKNKFYNI